MAGHPERAEKLNYTLHWIIDLLESKGIDDWFIMYGTLIGVAREGSCIDGDDDIDICINQDKWDDVYDVLKKKNMLTPLGAYVQPNFMCTRKTDKLCQVDFYLCDVTESGDFIDTWSKLRLTECYDEDGQLPTMTFEGREVPVPHNTVKKLETRYGPRWRERIKRGTPEGDGYNERQVL